MGWGRYTLLEADRYLPQEKLLKAGIICTDPCDPV
jgi:hypothetical protein